MILTAAASLLTLSPAPAAEPAQKLCISEWELSVGSPQLSPLAGQSSSMGFLPSLLPEDRPRGFSVTCKRDFLGSDFTRGGHITLASLS